MKTRIERAIETAKNLPRHKGKAELLRHLEGRSLTRDAAIKAKCYECSPEGEPCSVCTCPLQKFTQWEAV